MIYRILSLLIAFAIAALLFCAEAADKGYLMALASWGLVLGFCGITWLVIWLWEKGGRE